MCFSRARHGVSGLMMFFLMRCFYLGQGYFLLFVCLFVCPSCSLFPQELWTRSVSDIDDAAVGVLLLLLLLLFLAGSNNPDIAIHYTRKGEQPDFLPPLKEMLNDPIYSTPSAIAYISELHLCNTHTPHPLPPPTPHPHPTPKHPSNLLRKKSFLQMK